MRIESYAKASAAKRRHAHRLSRRCDACTFGCPRRSTRLLGGDIVIGHPHAAPPATGKPIEIGLALVDRGAEPDRLVAVTSSAASDVRLYNAEHAEATGIDLEPGRPIALKPGRMHIHVEGLQTKLATHSKMPLTLTFARAGTVEVQVLIEAEVSH